MCCIKSYSSVAKIKIPTLVLHSLMRVCSLNYPACKTHAPYFIVTVACPVLLYISTLSHIKARFSDKRYWTQGMFWFSQQLCSEIFPILHRVQPDIIIIVRRSSGKMSVTFIMFKWNLNFLDRFSKKYLNITIKENPSSGCRVVPCRRKDGRTDRHHEEILRPRLKTNFQILTL